jgi:hypothetical protein
MRKYYIHSSCTGTEKNRRPKFPSTARALSRLATFSFIRWPSVKTRRWLLLYTPKISRIGLRLLRSLLKTSHTKLRELSPRYVILTDESHCHALATELAGNRQARLSNSCSFTEAGINLFLHSLDHEQDPTKLFQCEVDAGALASALQRNRCLKTLPIKQALVEHRPGPG